MPHYTGRILDDVVHASTADAPPSDDTSKTPTVSGRFRASLNQLSATMMATHQHFIRCMKPNQHKKPGKLEGLNVCRQMRYLGVHAVIEINRIGCTAKRAPQPWPFLHACSV